MSGTGTETLITPVEDKISDSVLIQSIQSYLNEDSRVKILKKEIKSATKPGDNYISSVYQVGVTYSIGNDDDDSPSFDIQFIVKCIQDSAVFESLVNVSKVFEKEKLMYETILPALEATSGQTFAPKCFYIQEEGFKLMVFNDLKELGYKMVDRQKGLDFAHCQLLIGRLAAFHASSLVFMRDINLQPMELLGQGMSADPILVECVFKSNLAKLIEVAGEWTGEPGLESIVEHLKRAFDNYATVYKMPMATAQDQFRVINHGDAWCNNFMFAYDANGTPTDVILLDHQMPFYSSPGYDLNYFLVTSPDLQTRLHREEELLTHYKTLFNEKISALGFKDLQLSGEELRAAYEEKSIFGFTMMLTILPLIMRSVSEEEAEQDESSMDPREGVKRIQNALFSNEDFIAILKYSLRKFCRMGTFDKLP